MGLSRGISGMLARFLEHNHEKQKQLCKLQNVTVGGERQREGEGERPLYFQIVDSWTAHGPGPPTLFIFILWEISSACSGPTLLFYFVFIIYCNNHILRRQVFKLIYNHNYVQPT